MFALIANPIPHYDEEFKLPKTASMIIILTANLLLQVCYSFRLRIKNDWTDRLIDIVFHYHLVVERICRASRRRFDLLWRNHWHSHCVFRDRSSPHDEVRPW